MNKPLCLVFGECGNDVVDTSLAFDTQVGQDLGKHQELLDLREFNKDFGTGELSVVDEKMRIPAILM
jgi:hypothetical protein